MKTCSLSFSGATSSDNYIYIVGKSQDPSFASLVLSRVGGSGPDIFFTQYKKVPCRLPSLLYGVAEKSLKYSTNAATLYSALVTTDHLWSHPQAWSPALRCGYEIETRARFCIRAQHV